MFGAIFGASVRLRNSLYDSGRLRSRRLAGPVVSVGNISVGGAGKTPFVIALGELLQQRGIAFDILSRGYRRATKGVLEVVPSGSPADFGDEPLLIAHRLKAPVIVGESRYEAGRWSEGKFGPRLHLLDDGFQHRQLARDFDIVLVTAEDARGRLLPEGQLREPLSSIRRADAVVIADDINPTHLPLHGDQALWRIHRGIEIIPPTTSPRFQASAISNQSKIENQKSKMETSSISPRAGSETETETFLAFCAIARPHRFFHDLNAAGIATAAELSFPDHHRYAAADIDSLLAAKAKSNAAAFVTTDKDLINLGPFAARLHPLAIARVTLELLDSRYALDRMLSTLEHRGKQTT